MRAPVRFWRRSTLLRRSALTALSLMILSCDKSITQTEDLLPLVANSTVCAEFSTLASG